MLMLVLQIIHFEHSDPMIALDEKWINKVWQYIPRGLWMSLQSVFSKVLNQCKIGIHPLETSNVKDFKMSRQSIE